MFFLSTHCQQRSLKHENEKARDEGPGALEGGNYPKKITQEVLISVFVITRFFPLVFVPLLLKIIGSLREFLQHLGGQRVPEPALHKLSFDVCLCLSLLSVC